MLLKTHTCSLNLPKINVCIHFPCPSLSQYSDENMMDPYNLAICFGPTLMPIPDGQDPVACQAHVNEVIKMIIIHNEVIFPSHRELDGPVYEKCMTGGEEYWQVLATPDGEVMGTIHIHLYLWLQSYQLKLFFFFLNKGIINVTLYHIISTLKMLNIHKPSIYGSVSLYQ